MCSSRDLDPCVQGKAGPLVDVGTRSYYPSQVPGSKGGGAPRWRLDKVKALVAEGKFEVLYKRAAAFFETRHDARAAAEAFIRAVELRHYAGTKPLGIGECDEYAMPVNGAGWYLKITIDESMPGVVVVSLHPLEHPIRTRGGEVKP